MFSKIKVPKVQVKNLKKLGKIKRKSNKGSEITEPEINEIENGDENSLEEGYLSIVYILQVCHRSPIDFKKLKVLHFRVIKL